MEGLRVVATETDEFYVASITIDWNRTDYKHSLYKVIVEYKAEKVATSNAFIFPPISGSIPRSRSACRGSSCHRKTRASPGIQVRGSESVDGAVSPLETGRDRPNYP